jgi:hypothetical protein
MDDMESKTFEIENAPEQKHPHLCAEEQGIQLVHAAYGVGDERGYKTLGHCCIEQRDQVEAERAGASLLYGELLNGNTFAFTKTVYMLVHMGCGRRSFKDLRCKSLECKTAGHPVRSWHGHRETVLAE